MSPSMRPKELINLGFTLQDHSHHVRVLSSDNVTRTIDSPPTCGRVFSESNLMNKKNSMIESQNQKIFYAKEGV